MRRRSLALAGPLISAKNRGDALIWDRALNRANMVFSNRSCRMSHVT